MAKSKYDEKYPNGIKEILFQSKVNPSYIIGGDSAEEILYSLLENLDRIIHSPIHLIKITTNQDPQYLEWKKAVADEKTTSSYEDWAKLGTN